MIDVLVQKLGASRIVADSVDFARGIFFHIKLWGSQHQYEGNVNDGRRQETQLINLTDAPRLNVGTMHSLRLDVPFTGHLLTDPQQVSFMVGYGGLSSTYRVQLPKPRASLVI